MKFLDRLDRVVRPIAINHLPEILVAGQVITYFMVMFSPEKAESLMLVWNKVFAGEVWRLVTFPFFPPGASILVALYFLFFYFLSKSLENYWGTVRFNAYMYAGVVFTMLGALVAPDWPVTGFYFKTTVLLAFATLHPNYEIHLMLILPIKMKWLAALQFAIFFLVLISGGIESQVMVVAAMANYFLFFGGDLFRSLTRMNRRAKWAGSQMRERRGSVVARHRCTVCGIDSKSHPFEDFRYCSKCDGQHAYCEEHLHNHQHIGDSSGSS